MHFAMLSMCDSIVVETNIEKAFDLGVIDFLSRPFSERIVTRRVMTTIRLFRRQKELVDELEELIAQKASEHENLQGLTAASLKLNFTDDVPTAVEAVAATETAATQAKAVKQVIDGQLVIKTADGTVINTAGQRIK